MNIAAPRDFTIFDPSAIEPGDALSTQAITGQVLAAARSHPSISSHEKTLSGEVQSQESAEAVFEKRKMSTAIALIVNESAYSLFKNGEPLAADYLYHLVRNAKNNQSKVGVKKIYEFIGHGVDRSEVRSMIGGTPSYYT